MPRIVVPDNRPCITHKEPPRQRPLIDVLYDTRSHPFWGHRQFRPYIIVGGTKHFILCRVNGASITDSGMYVSMGIEADNLFRQEEEAHKDVEAFLKGLL